MTNQLIKTTRMTYIPGTPGVVGSPGSPARGAYTSWRMGWECGYKGFSETWLQNEEGQWVLFTVGPYNYRCEWKAIPTYHEATAAVPPTESVAPTLAQTIYDHNLGWNAGGRSISFFEFDGYCEFKVSPSAVGVVAGLNYTNPDASYVNIDYAFYVAHGIARVMELGVEKLYIGPVVATDVFEIRRINGVVTYYINDVLKYTSLTASSGVAFMDASLYSGGDYIDEPAIGGLASAYLNMPAMTTAGGDVAYASSYMSMLPMTMSSNYAQGSALSMEYLAVAGGRNGYGSAALQMRAMTAEASAQSLMVPAFALANLPLVPMTLAGHGITGEATAKAVTGFGTSANGVITVNVISPPPGTTTTVSFPGGTTITVGTDPLTGGYLLSTPDGEIRVVINADGTATVTYPGGSTATVQPNADGSITVVLSGGASITLPGTAGGTITVSSAPGQPNGTTTITTVSQDGDTQGQTITVNGNGSITVTGSGASPGATVTITFPSGSTTTTVDSSGNYTATSGVSQPVGTTTVTVSANGYISLAPMTMFAGEGTGRGQAMLTMSALTLTASAFEGNTNASMQELTVSTSTLSYIGFVDVALYSSVTGTTTMVTLMIRDAAMTSSVTGTPTMVYSAVLQALIDATVEITAGIPVLTEAGEVWVVNADTGASSMYEDYGFNSFGKLAGSYYGAKADGIYLLEGDDDEGAPIRASISLGMQDFGSTVKKTVPNCYIGVAASGNVYLRVIADGVTYTYVTNRSDDYIRTQRVKLGRGIKATHLTFELYNSDGADFELNTVEFEVANLTRRI